MPNVFRRLFAVTILALLFCSPPAELFGAQGGSGDKGADSAVDDATVNPDGTLGRDPSVEWIQPVPGLYDRYSSNPDDPGWWKNKQGNIRRTTWISKKTDCKPCKSLVSEYNWLMQEIFDLRYRVVAGKAEKKSVGDGFQKIFDANRGKLSLATASMMVQERDSYFDAQDALIKELERQLKEAEAAVNRLARAIVECEKQCSAGIQKTGITIGQDGVIGEPPPAEGWALPFAWAGPYHTDCYPCQKLAARLNELPTLYRVHLIKLKREERYLRAAKFELAVVKTKTGALGIFNSDSRQERTDELEEIVKNSTRLIKEEKAKLEKIKQHFDQVLKMLRDCEKKYCTRSAAKPCSAPLNYAAVAVGPKSEIGGGVANAVQDTATGVIGGALGGLLGGGFGFGGGGGGGGGFGFGGMGRGSGGGGGREEPELHDNPVKNLQPFTVPGTDIKVNVGGMFNEQGHLLVSSKIDEAPGDGTFQSVTLHNMDCQRMKPMRYLPFELYQDWSLSVQFTYITEYYEDGQLVSRDVQQTGWNEIDSGRNVLGDGVLGISGQDQATQEPGIWKDFGFNRAKAGINWLGTEFNAMRADLSLPVALSIGITQPDNDPVTAVPLNLLACPADDGTVTFMPVQDVLRDLRHARGGMTQVPPPDPELMKQMERELGGETDSVVDELSPLSPGGGGGGEPTDSVIGELTPLSPGDGKSVTDGGKAKGGGVVYTESMIKAMEQHCPRWNFDPSESAQGKTNDAGQKADTAADQKGDEVGRNFVDAFIKAFGDPKYH